MTSRKKTVLNYTLIGATVTLIFILTSVWVLLGARKTTSDAIARISTFYLQELAEKRSGLVSAEIEGYFDDMNDAIEAISEEDLKNVESLRSYLKRARLLINVDRLALVNSDGLVYTGNSTSSGMSRYGFLSEDITEPIIRTSNVYGAKPQVVLAIPVSGLTFEGAEFRVCFAQIDIDNLVAAIIAEEQDTDTYVALFYRDGEPLTSASFAVFDAGENLLEALSSAQLSEDSSAEILSSDFENGGFGHITFTYKDTEGTVSYKPVEGTNWMLAVYVSSATIFSQVGGIGKNMMFRSFLQILVMVAVLSALFIYLVRRSRKTSEATLKLEKEAGNQVREALSKAEYRQQEMESIHGALGSAPWNIEFDESGSIVRCVWSDTMKSMLEASDVTSDSFDDFTGLITDDFRASFVDEFNAVVKDATGARSFDFEAEYITPKGNHKWFRTSGRVTRRGDGSPANFFGIIVDITDRKNAELALEDALKGAQQANISKTTFLSNMSHDIRTPMNAIIGYTTLAEDHIDDKAAVSDYLDKIQTSSHHLLSLINDVLDMSRIESGHLTLEEKEISLKSIASNLAAIIKSNAEEADVTFNVSASSVANDRVICDELKLNQVLLNLVSNAIKFTKPGGRVDVTISQEGGVAAGVGCYKITVADTGIGMSEEFMGRIFEPFERERTSTVSGIEGTGLGMPITKSIVDKMGGTVDVESKVGCGTTFTVNLPLKVVSDPEADAQESRSEALDFGGKKVLLVEDNALNREIATAILENVGLSVDQAVDGDIAVDMIRENPDKYDLVLMDIQMPNMNGYEATTQIRKFSDIPIVAMTANAFEEDKQHAIDVGMNGHVAKPIEIPKLMEMLGRFL